MSEYLNSTLHNQEVSVESLGLSTAVCPEAFGEQKAHAPLVRLLLRSLAESEDLRRNIEKGSVRLSGREADRCICLIALLAKELDVLVDAIEVGA